MGEDGGGRHSTSFHRLPCGSLMFRFYGIVISDPSPAPYPD